MSELPSRSPTRGKHAWSAKKTTKQKKHRFATLLILGAAFLACSGLFIYFLLDYSIQPKTHFLYLQLNNHDSPGVTTLATINEKDIKDFAASLKIDTPVALKALGAESLEVAIRNTATALKLNPQDVLVLYLRTQTLVANNKDSSKRDALLITADFDPKGDRPSISFTDVCKELCKLQCRKIVILLDHSDLELANSYALQVRDYSRDYLDAWLATWKEDSSISDKAAEKLIVLSAKSDAQPSHASFATPTTQAKTLFFFALEKAATDVVGEATKGSSSIDGIPFADFFTKVYRYTKMGSGSLQTPVLVAGKQQIDPSQLSNPALSFTLGNLSKSQLPKIDSANEKVKSASQKDAPDPSTATTSDLSSQENGEANAKSFEPILGLTQAWELVEQIQSNAIIPPTDFAPHTWHSLLESLCTIEHEQRVGTPIAELKSEVDSKLKSLQQLSLFLTSPNGSAKPPFDSPWQAFLNDPHYRAWTFDLATPPENSPDYPYQPDDKLSFPLTRSLSRGFARYGNSFPDWLLFQHYYPADSSRLETPVEKYLQSIISTDTVWTKLKADPIAVSLTEREQALNALQNSEKEVAGQLANEIERLESNLDMTRWQIHYRIHRLLQVSSLSLSNRLRLWKLLQKPFKDLAEKEPVGAELKLSLTPPTGLSNLEATSLLVSSLSKDAIAIVPPTLDRKLQFSTNSLRQVIFQSTISPEDFPFEIQRCDGTTPPTTIQILIQGAADDQLKVTQAGNTMPWNKPTKVSLNNGRASLNLSALVQANPELPQLLSLQINPLDQLPDNAVSDIRNTHSLKLLWPLSNKFELFATYKDWSKANLSQGQPILAAAVKNTEGEPAALAYQLSINNQSQSKRKALIQFYRVADIGTAVKNRGSNRDRQGKPLIADQDALRLRDRWQPLLKQPLELDFPANDFLTVNLPNSTTPKANGEDNGQNKEAESNPWISVPDGLLCTITELDQDRRPKTTDIAWISFDAIDPIDTQYKWLKDTKPFRYDSQRKKLYFSAIPTDTVAQIPGIENIPVTIELQMSGARTINKALEVEPLKNSLVERELPTADFADKPFLVHISFGSFPRQATFSFPDARSEDPQREPELTAFLGVPSVQLPNTVSNTEEGEEAKNKNSLQPLPRDDTSTAQRWVVDNTADLTNTGLVVDIDAVFPYLQAFLGYTIRNTLNDDLKKNEVFYEPINRRFEVRFTADGKLEVRHLVDKWRITTPAKSLFEEEGEYRLDLYRGPWTETTSVPIDQLITPIDTRIIIRDKTPPVPDAIVIKDSNGKSILKGANLQREKKYTVEITPVDEGLRSAGVGISKVVFGIDKNDDKELSEDEIDPKIVPMRVGDRWSAEITVEQDSIRIVARTIDYANNSQNSNCSERYQVSKGSKTKADGTDSSTSTKRYNLTIDVRLATTGDPPSKPVELQLEGHSVTSQPDSHTFNFEKIPEGSFKATARTTLGFDVYEVEETIEVSGKEPSILRQLKLQKKKPPMP